MKIEPEKALYLEWKDTSNWELSIKPIQLQKSHFEGHWAAYRLGQEQLLARLTRRHRLTIAVNLAWGIVQYGDTPWLDGNWSLKDVFLFRRPQDSATTIGKHLFVCRKASTTEVEEPHHQIESSQTSSIRNQALFRLGVVLIELWHGRSIDEISVSNLGPVIQNESDPNAKTVSEYVKLRLSARYLYEDAGPEYADAVHRCLRCDFTPEQTNLDDEEFRYAVIQGVVAPLEQTLGYMNGNYLDDSDFFNIGSALDGFTPALSSTVSGITDGSMARLEPNKPPALPEVSQRTASELPPTFYEVTTGPSETASEFSEGLPSSIGSHISQSSFGDVPGLEDVREPACRALAMAFWQDTELQSLYRDVSKTCSVDAFAKSHDVILCKLFEYVLTEDSTKSQSRTGFYLQQESQRQQVTAAILQLLGPEDRRRTLQLPKNPVSDGFILDRFFQSEPSRDPAFVKQAQGPMGDTNFGKEVNFLNKEELASNIDFFAASPASSIMKSTLRCLRNPETAISEALQDGKINTLETILVADFNGVAVGEFSWLKELDAAGYTPDEIAQLLMEDASDSPWIYSQPSDQNLKAVSQYCDPSFHVASCIHDVSLRSKNHGKVSSNLVTVPNNVFPLIQELCGIAGVVPHSRDKTTWNGAVAFSEDNSVAAVTYTIVDTDESVSTLLERSRVTLKSVVVAAQILQEANGCCDAFSVLCHVQRGESSLTETRKAVELRTIKFALVLQLLEELSQAEIRYDNLKAAALGVIAGIDQAVLQHGETMVCDNVVHVVSLAAQFVSLGFLAYSQAHVGPIQSFLLDTAQRKISLLGTCGLDTGSPWISGELTKLSCIGHMLRSPVFVFTIRQGIDEETVDVTGQKFDVLASAEDILGKKSEHPKLISFLLIWSG